VNTHLKERDSDTHGDTGAAEGTAVVGNGPGVTLEVLEDAGELELGRRDREKEFRSSRCRDGLTGAHRLHAVGRAEAEHLGDLLGRVLLGTAEDVRLGAVGVGELVNEGLRSQQGSGGQASGYIPWCRM